MMAYIHSKKVGETNVAEEVRVIEYRSNNDIIVKTNAGVICHAINNPFTGMLYADDVYGIVKNRKE